jgi:uncharacterized protein
VFTARVSLAVVTPLEPLLTLQEHDLALDRLRHRRETLPERATLAELELRTAMLTSELAVAERSRDEVQAEERKLGDEAQSQADQAAAVEVKLYSGTVTSPKELQALQADIEQLKKHQRAIEDRALLAMERREPFEGRAAELVQELAALTAQTATVSAALAAAEAEIDGEAAIEQKARDEVAATLDAGLVAEYERCRAKANGIGAARLVGNTCQGCHLSIPSTEVERVRKAAVGDIAHCDNCGTILVAHD